MYQSKVNNTQKYSDSQGEHIVHPAKLVFSNQLNLPVYPKKGDLVKNPKTEELYICNGSFLGGQKMFPIIISETEKIEVGDYAYDTHSQDIFVVENEMHLHTVNGVGNCHKILTLSEQFSDKHLQAIVDGKMKDGDEVLVKCDRKRNQYSVGINEYADYEQIHLNQQNNITLFKAFEAGAEWAKKNNY